MNMTYRELMEELQEMLPSQLNQKVVGWDEDLLIRLDGVTTLHEDYVDVGEGYEPAFGYTEDPEFDIQMYSSYKKGSIILDVRKL